MLNRLSHFWQELKRRKVIRVITVYAAAAFVIIELVDIVAPNLGLPTWTFNLVLILLLVGFVITVIVSWIYDIHPEGGIVKTEPAHRVKDEDIPRSSNNWKVASYVSFVVIVGLIVLNIIPHAKGTKEVVLLDKSIAVLPFVNDSPDEENAYFINGIMEEILLNLQAIKELRVPGRTSVEQYRTQTKSIPEITDELGVNYIVEGSGQRYGDRIVLRVQLIEGATDRHLWGDSYEEEITSTEVIIGIQSRIAKSIASELQALITSDEKTLIEKIPTTDLTAYDFYQRGREEYLKFLIDINNLEAIGNAEGYFFKALEYDSTFALAYAGLAMTLSSKIYSGTYYQYFSETYLQDTALDSVLVLANLALSFDDQLAEAYLARGDYFRQVGQRDRALIEYEKSLAYNPNSWEAYLRRAELIHNVDNIKYIDNLLKASILNRGSELPMLLGRLSEAFRATGFPDKSLEYINKRLKLDGDSIEYLLSMTFWENFYGSRSKAIDYLLKAYNVDPSILSIAQYLGNYYHELDQYEEAYFYFNKYLEGLKKTDRIDINFLQRIGYTYWKTGYKKEAEYYFDKQIETSKRVIELNRPHALFSYYDLAGVYAFRGERDSAYASLRNFNQREIMPLWMVELIKSDPLFYRIRDEPEFQQIVRDVEVKYQVEHERVRRWLEENEML